MSLPPWLTQIAPTSQVQVNATLVPAITNSGVTLQVLNETVSVGAGAGSNGDVSATTALSTGSTTPRTLASRFSDVINVLDWGASPSATAAQNTTAINAAITAGAGVARVYIPPGSYSVNYFAGLPSYLHLTIDGTLTLAAGNNLRVFRALNQSNIRIDGDGTIDGNKANNTYTGGGAFPAGIWIGTSTNIDIAGITIQNCVNWGFSLDTCTGALVDNVTVINCGNSAQFNMSSVNCWARNCTFSGTGDIGFAFYQGTSQSGIVNSTVTTSAATGITVLHDGGYSSLISNDILISGCMVYNNVLGGISVSTGAGTTGNHTNILIEGNHCFNNNTGAAGTTGGIAVNTGYAVSVIGNTIYGDAAGPAGVCYGISVLSGSLRTKLAGNTIYNEGVGGTAGVGIYVSSAANLLVSDNSVYDDQGTKSMLNGIAGTASSGVVLGINDLGTMIGASNGMTNASDTVVFGALAGALYSNAVTVTGVFTIDAEYVDASFTSVAPTTGNTYTLANSNTTAAYTGASPLAALTIVLPASPVNKQIISFTVHPAVTALTINANSGQSITGPAVSAAASTSCTKFSYLYVASQTAWYRLQ